MRSSRRRVNSRPMTEASCSVRFGASCKRSIRAMITSWMVSGTKISSSALGQDIAVSGPSEGPDLQEGLDHLLDEEGIAFGLADDQGLERLGEGLGGQQRLRHLDAVRGREGIEGDPRVIGALPEGLHVTRAVGEDAQDATGRECCQP